MLYYDMTRKQESILRLLAKPDPPDLPQRGHVYRWPSAVDPDRQKQELILRWLQWREVQIHDWEDA